MAHHFFAFFFRYKDNDIIANPVESYRRKRDIYDIDPNYKYSPFSVILYTKFVRFVQIRVMITN